MAYYKYLILIISLHNPLPGSANTNVTERDIKEQQLSLTYTQDMVLSVHSLQGVTL